MGLNAVDLRIKLAALADNPNVQNIGFKQGVIAAGQDTCQDTVRACKAQMLQVYLSELCGLCCCGCSGDGVVALRSATECPRILELQLPSHAWRSVALARRGMFYTACDSRR